jgi:hypothetical protein
MAAVLLKEHIKIMPLFLQLAALLPGLALAAAAAAPPVCVVDEDFASGRTAASKPRDPGASTPEGWMANTPASQLKYDLGRHYRKGLVEIEVRGPLKQQQKHALFSAWNEEAASDGDRKTQGFFQLRLMHGGMMLRLTYRPGGRSFEGEVAPLEWEDKWYRIEGTWDTARGESTLKRDGVLLKSGKFNAPFEGFRWVFIGTDNYQNFQAIPGVVYRRLKVCVSD